MVKPLQLGHADIRVSDLERAEKFYTQALGLEVVRRRGNTIFLSAREHSHELAIGAMGPEAQEPDRTRVGTNHFAWQMNSFEDLQAIYQQLKANGVEILRTRSNSFSMGIYFNDPDGNGNEAYYEDLEMFRKGSWEGEYHRKLEEVPV